MTAFHFGTKAETLERLASRVNSAEVLPVFYFSVERYRREPGAVVGDVQRRFAGASLIVRSSAVGEDSESESKAGMYLSLPNVDGSSAEGLHAAIQDVVASYAGNPADQVLIQPMLADVVMSGVVMTSNLEDGAPYFTIAYDDSGSTDAVTAGTSVHKTVHVHHEHRAVHVRSPRIAALLTTVRELQQVCGRPPLDIEFAIASDDRVFVLQVRRIGAWRTWNDRVIEEVNRALPHVQSYLNERSAPRAGLLGETALFGVMPDWNPAEMIGTVPGRLATSLYRRLITRDAWRISRAQFGYRDVRGEELMIVVGERPYIDVRNSFNSFVPADLPDALGARLVDGWLERLGAEPELHDKVEFEIVHTCVDFDVESEFRARYPGLLSSEQEASYMASLTALTARALDISSNGSLSHAEATVCALAGRQEHRTTRFEDESDTNLLIRADDGLSECRASGTIPFATLARHGFIAETLLRSSVRRGVLSPERVMELKRSINTVTVDFSVDLAELVAGRLAETEFFRTYGHLRPGTYDIKSLRYADRDDVLSGLATADAGVSTPPAFTLTEQERRGLDALLRGSGLPGDADSLMEYVQRAVRGREYGKFVFTRNLSDALERMAEWGSRRGVSRSSLAHIAVGDILGLVHKHPLQDVRRHMLELANAGEWAAQCGRATKLGFLIRDEADLYVIPVHRTTPTFVGGGVVRAPMVFLRPDNRDTRDLYDRIVCVECADPGFDYIFTRGIAGLVTKYGGSNSHMAIRCNELGVPGAIGCGEETFNRLVRSNVIELDCDHHTVRPLHVD